MADNEPRIDRETTPGPNPYREIAPVPAIRPPSRLLVVACCAAPGPCVSSYPIIRLRRIATLEDLRTMSDSIRAWTFENLDRGNFHRGEMVDGWPVGVKAARHGLGDFRRTITVG